MGVTGKVYWSTEPTFPLSDLDASGSLNETGLEAMYGNHLQQMEKCAIFTGSSCLHGLGWKALGDEAFFAT